MTITGGVGGNAGHIRIFNLNNPNQPTISAAQGTLGEQGKVQCPEFATLKVYGSKNFIAKTPFGRRVNSADVNQVMFIQVFLINLLYVNTFLFIHRIIYVVII